MILCLDPIMICSMMKHESSLLITYVITLQSYRSMGKDKYIHIHSAGTQLRFVDLGQLTQVTPASQQRPLR